MANVLPFKVRVRAVRALVDGNSIRAAARLSGADKDVVMRLGVMVGLGCMKLHDKLVKGVVARYIEVDETWTYVGRHEKRKRKDDPRWFGDMYTMFALDTGSKLVPSYLTGKRSPTGAVHFMQDLRKRVIGKPQVSVDGWPPWIEAVRRSFGHSGVHLGSVVKEYQKEGRPGIGAAAYGRVKSTEKTAVYGEPDQDRISTSMAERLNLTTRMHQRRLTRLTNAYSKKKTNLVAAVGLHFMHYNFVRKHETIGTTPAVKAGLTDHEWTLEELVKAALEEMGAPTGETPPKRPAHYKRKTHADGPRSA